MLSDRLQIFVQPNYAAQTTDLYVKHGGAWIQNFECVQADEGTIPPVALQLCEDEAQALMDRLWMAGFRPTEGKGSAGALAATERHLEDMRKLVFESPLVLNTRVKGRDTDARRH